MRYISKVTLDTLLGHHSVRNYSNRIITEDTLELILTAGFQSSSSNYLQCVSAIRVRDESLRKKIQGYAHNQTYITACAEFLIFCIDFTIHKKINEQAPIDETELFVMGLSDVAIVAQSTLVAAESLGIGAVLLSSFRSNIKEVSQLLNLPRYSVPILGICLGYPNQQEQNYLQKPRLPLALCVHNDQYQTKHIDDYVAYNNQVNQYYQKRREHHVNYISNIKNKLMPQAYQNNILNYLQQQGFLIK